MAMKIRIGTRGSLLALAQTQWVAERIAKFFPSAQPEICVIKTMGDTLSDHDFFRVTGKGIFVREIEIQLLEHKIDLAVHSLKDLPTQIPPGLELGAVPPREKPFEALISRDGAKLASLQRGARVGTASPRRAAQLLALRRDLTIIAFRGNLDTRIRKVREGEVDATVVALAGLRRLGREQEAAEVIPPEIIMPAPAQGALAVEVRRGDLSAQAGMRELLEALNDAKSLAEVTAERAFLERLGGGCRTPIGCLARAGEKRLLLHAVITDPKGERVFRAQREGKKSHAARIGVHLAEDMLKQGAASLFSPA
jgi:hydroxymethylbilane synthase